MKKEIWWKGILSSGFLWEKSEVSRWPQIMIIFREIQEFPGGILAEKTKCVSQLWRLVILSKRYKSPQSQSLVHLHDKYLFFVCKVLGIGLGLQKKQGMEQKQFMTWWRLPMKGVTRCARDSAALNVPSRLHCHDQTCSQIDILQHDMYLRLESLNSFEPEVDSQT